MKVRNSLQNSNIQDSFTLNQPVTRQIIALETGFSYTTVCRRLREMDFVENRKYVCPSIYKQVLEELGFLDD